MSDGIPQMSTELAEITTRLSKNPEVPDIVRAYELLFGVSPEPTRPVKEVAEEVAAALSIMSASRKKGAAVRRSTIELKATDGKAMTVAELRAFLEGLAATVQPKVRISFGGGIKSIKATEDR